MQKSLILDDHKLEDLIQELKTRENIKKKGLSRTQAEHSPLMEVDAKLIIKNVKKRQKVIYGVDDRVDLYEVTDQAVLNNVDSVVSIWTEDLVIDNGDGTSTLDTDAFGTAFELCGDEPFWDQPVGCHCSGVLVAPDIIATAGHCADEDDVTSMRFVFGYCMINSGNAHTIINNNEIYSGHSIIARIENNIDDWGLIRLDRPVLNHRIASIRRSGAIADDQSLYVIGHPSGLPAKYADGAWVRNNGSSQFFVANLDTYAGNSGSPVFNAETHQVEGLLVRGEQDFVWNDSCFESLVCPINGCDGEECIRTTEFSDLVPESVSVPFSMPMAGLYSIQQRSNNRFLDAYTGSGNDFSAITRTAQNNNTQRWVFTPLEGVYTFQQKSSGRYLDAYTAGDDFSTMTRTIQNNDTQRWIIRAVSNNVYTIRQKDTGRFLDAYTTNANNFSAVTRTAQDNDTQHWRITRLENNTYTIQQQSNNRYLDAYESAGNDFNAVTRTAQNNDTQRWILTLVEGNYTIQQRSNFRFLDAFVADNDFNAVTRTAQNNDTQRWIVRSENRWYDHSLHTIRQKETGRFLDAYQSEGDDHSAVTRTAQNNNTQRWRIRPLNIELPQAPIQAGIFTMQQQSSNRFADAYEASNNHLAITRPPQNNNTQRWIFSPIGGVYTIRQRSSNLYLDAYTSNGNDYSATVRAEQENDMQYWILMPLGYQTYTIQQLHNRRFLDAFESSNGHNAVTRTAQNNDTQRWVLTALGGGNYTIQQKSTGRFLDAFSGAADDFSAMTRTVQNNNTQRWILDAVGGVYTIQQRSTNRFLDGNPSEGDFAAFTRPAQNNNTQWWVAMNLGSDIYTLQHMVNGRFLDAYESSSSDFRMMMREAQNNNTQRWRIIEI